MTAIVSKSTSLRSRLLSGGSWALSGKIISSASTLGANILLARLLSPEGMGSFFLAFSIVSVFSIFAQWGLGRGLVKLVASELADGHGERARSAITSAIIIVLSISLVLAMVMHSPVGKWFLNWLTGAGFLASISGLIGLWLLVLSLQGIISESFRGFHDIRFATIFSGMLTAVISMLLYLFSWLKADNFELVDAVLIMVSAAAISLIIGGLLLRKRLIRYESSRSIELSKVFYFGFPLMLTNVFLFATLQLHMWVLAYYQPETEVALYGASLRLVLLLTMPLAIINAIIPPLVADMYSQKKYGRVQNLLQKTATLMSVPAFIVFLIIIVFGSEILGLVYGETYTMAYIPFAVLAVGQLINVLTGSPGILLTMSGREKVVMKTALGASMLGITASFIGVQMYGATGAALGYTVGVIVNNTAMWMYSINRLHIKTHGSMALMKDQLIRIRAQIENDEVNGGVLCFLGTVASKIELFWWRLCRYEIIEVFGDSHASIFRGLNYRSWLTKKRFRITSVKGATAYGIGNPNSKTNALDIFKRKLKEIPKERSIIFMMGEVDIGFLIWLRADDKGIPVVDCMKETFTRYTKFLNDVMAEHPYLKICSVPLPTIGDNEAQGEVATARSQIKSTQKERTIMTLKFNQMLKSWASENNCEYMDFDIYALDSTTKLVKRELLNNNVRDHHYNENEFYKLIRKVFKL